ncbi:MAG: response regulator transcription factor [Acutalibacteraceae bacterium]|nr:response regulator transcription factor [Acutalibacteraceae bacterium]
MIRVLIVEDQKMAQENMEAIIKSSENYTLSGIISNSADTELFCMREPVDLILMDVCTARDENGIEACAVVKRKFPEIKIIIITSMAEHTFIEKAKAAKADSFWYKDSSRGELLDVMDKTMAGEHIFPKKTPEVKLGLSTSYKLTHSELDVIRALMQSTSDEDAASMLGCTKANIRWHIGKILDKTGYRTRMELLIAVAQKNLIIVTPDKALEENN